MTMTLDERIARVQKWLGDRGMVNVQLHRGDAWDTTPYAERADALLSALEAVMDGKTRPFTGLGDSPAQPQPVAQGEAIGAIEACNRLDLLLDGYEHEVTGDTLHDKDWLVRDFINDTRVWEVFEALYDTPTVPTGHRVVPVEPEDLSLATDGFGINKQVNAMLADVLRFLAQPGQKVIWRGSFRWFDDDGVLSNHYDGMDIDHLARDFDYEVHYDAHHAALVSKKTAPDAGGV